MPSYCRHCPKEDRRECQGWLTHALPDGKTCRHCSATCFEAVHPGEPRPSKKTKYMQVCKQVDPTSGVRCDKWAQDNGGFCRGHQSSALKKQIAAAAFARKKARLTLERDASSKAAVAATAAAAAAAAADADAAAVLTAMTMSGGNCRGRGAGGKGAQRGSVNTAAHDASLFQTRKRRGGGDEGELELAAINDKRKRKRKQKGGKAGASLSSSSSLSSSADLALGGQLSPLSGHVVAVTADQSADATFEELRDDARALGASFSGAVHRNVSALVATAHAVEQNSQRIRKAAKYGVSVVSRAWLAACKAEGRFVATAPFEFDLPLLPKPNNNVDNNAQSSDHATATATATSKATGMNGSAISAMEDVAATATATATARVAMGAAALATTPPPLPPTPTLATPAKATSEDGYDGSTLTGGCEDEEEDEAEGGRSGEKKKKKKATKVAKSFVEALAAIGSNGIGGGSGSVDGMEWTVGGGVLVDFGCCCSCHDDGAESCEWCADLHLNEGEEPPPVPPELEESDDDQDVGVPDLVPVKVDLEKKQQQQQQQQQ